jgi:hypothetical protein
MAPIARLSGVSVQQQHLGEIVALRNLRVAVHFDRISCSNEKSHR